MGDGGVRPANLIDAQIARDDQKVTFGNRWKEAMEVAEGRDAHRPDDDTIRAHRRSKPTFLRYNFVVEFRTSIDIAAPPDVVWSVMSDVERWHEWTESVRSITLVGGGPIRVGTRAWIKQPKFPPAMWKVTTIEPGRSFTWESGAPGMRVYANHSVDPIGPHTRATLVLYYQGPVGRLLARMTRNITHRYLKYEAEGLKKRSEAKVTP